MDTQSYTHNSTHGGHVPNCLEQAYQAPNPPNSQYVTSSQTVPLRNKPTTILSPTQPHTYTQSPSQSHKVIHPGTQYSETQVLRLFGLLSGNHCQDVPYLSCLTIPPLELTKTSPCFQASPQGEFLILLAPLLGSPNLNLLHPAHLYCLPAVTCPASLPWPPSVRSGPFCGHELPPGLP